MFEFLKKRRDINNTIPQPVFSAQAAPVPGLIVPGNVLLKPKKWVTAKGRVGIVTAVDSSGYVKIDLVNKDGYTVERIRVPVGEVKLARFVEIPESRRPSQVVAATLGYV